MGSCRTMCLGFAWIPDDLGIWRVFFIFYFFEEVVDGGSVLPYLTMVNLTLPVPLSQCPASIQATLRRMERGS